MDIQFPQILFQIVNFSVVLGGVGFLLYRPIQKILDERMNRVAEGQKAATEALAEKEKLEILKEKLEKNANKEAVELLADAKKKADKQKREILAKAKQEALDEVKKIKSEWESEKKAIQEANKKQMIEAVVSVAYMVSKKKLDSKADEKLISEELDGVLAKI